MYLMTCSIGGPALLKRGTPTGSALILVLLTAAILTPEAGAWFHKPRCPKNEPRCDSNRTTKIRSSRLRSGPTAIQTKRHMNIDPFGGGQSPFIKHSRYYDVPPIDTESMKSGKQRRRERTLVLRNAVRIQKRRLKNKR